MIIVPGHSYSPYILLFRQGFAECFNDTLTLAKEGVRIRCVVVKQFLFLEFSPENAADAFWNDELESKV